MGPGTMYVYVVGSLQPQVPSLLGFRLIIHACKHACNQPRGEGGRGTRGTWVTNGGVGGPRDMPDALIPFNSLQVKSQAASIADIPCGRVGPYRSKHAPGMVGGCKGSWVLGAMGSRGSQPLIDQKGRGLNQGDSSKSTGDSCVWCVRAGQFSIFIIILFPVIVHLFVFFSFFLLLVCHND